MSFRRIVFQGVQLTLLTIVVGLFVCHSTFFCVTDGFTSVITRFGRPIRVLATPGPYWKLPAPIDQLHLIDNRRQILDTPSVTVITRDRRTIIVTPFAIWHVADPLLFFQAFESTAIAESSMADLLVAATNQELSRHDLGALVSTDPTTLETADVGVGIGADVQRTIGDRIGVKFDKVGWRRLEFPQENIQAVLSRMRAEREAEAGRLRAEGAKAAQAIRDAAHVKAQELLRQGRDEASRISADAERRAADVVATARRQNPQLYDFWSSLQASKQALNKDSIVVLSSDQGFFSALIPPCVPQAESGGEPLDDLSEQRRTVKSRAIEP
ncbi:MAG: protease modulator HflC [Pirellulales bacterium]